jgi:phosphohistidine phosphatase
MEGSSARRLFVVRHAKSDWNTGLPDIERPLNARGGRDAPAAGRWFADRGVVPDAVVVSPSVRTRTTWDLVAGEAGLRHVPVSVRAIVYDADVDDLLGTVRQLPTEAHAAVLVCHWPGCSDLVQLLSAGHGEPEALDRIRLKYPTSGIAEVEVAVPWQDVGAGVGRLAAFAVPRG